MGDLEKVFAERKRKPKKGSYTNAMLKDTDRLREKLLEEACELAMATRSKKKKHIAEEAADLLYHSLLLLFSTGVRFEDVERVLEGRRK